MTFEVRPEALKDLARQFDVLAGAAGEAVCYAGHTEPATSGGSVMVRLLTATAPVRPAVEELFAHLSRIGAASADELVAAARRYEQTDRAAADRAAAGVDRLRSVPGPGRGR